ncbi:MAG: metallophosphoesterase family protein, partial [Planctomycetota bacterium]
MGGTVAAWKHSWRKGEADFDAGFEVDDEVDDEVRIRSIVTGWLGEGRVPGSHWFLLVFACLAAIVQSSIGGGRLYCGQAVGGRTMTRRTIAIGDIHGHSAALSGLIRQLELEVDDTLIFLGDYVDRGPDSKGVIDLILGLRDRCQLVPLMGNHEEMMLQARIDRRVRWMWLDNGGDQALLSYGDEGNLRSVPESHFEFLGCLARLHETETHFFIHANYSPNFKLSEQSPM